MSIFKPENYEYLLESNWKDKDNKLWKLTGILFAKDDWYWYMSRINPSMDEIIKSKDKILLSCVSNIEGFGFTLI